MAATEQRLPSDDPNRFLIHNEVHARPSATISLPAMVIYLAVLNDKISRNDEYMHLCLLPGQQSLSVEVIKSNFLRLQFPDYSLKWERHTEFTSYTILQSLDDDIQSSNDPDILFNLKLPENWLRTVPGTTIAAIKMTMLHGDISKPNESLDYAKKWLGNQSIVASLVGNTSHSLAVTDFRLDDNGFENMVVITPQETTGVRAGRVSQRLIELETYRLMALRGFPIAKQLATFLAQSDKSLAKITSQLENKSSSDQQLLDQLISLASEIECAITENTFCFSATRAYDELVSQRIAELRERSIHGTQTIGDFMQRRLSPAIATVAYTAERLASLSERISRVSALLHTRVDIATELQNQQLLEKLTRGQELQLRLQATVEGLSIAAISYYVVSLVYYLAKALKAYGLPIHIEIFTGTLIPIVLLVVWYTTSAVNKKIRFND
jgi:uncharacterized membrane-anchored protein